MVIKNIFRMRTNIFLFLFFIAPVLAFSQDIPQWVRYGMNENAIIMSLGVDSRGYVKDKNGVVQGAYVGREKAGSTRYIYFEGLNGSMSYFDKPIQTIEDLDKLSKLTTGNVILHYFIIDPNKGLVAYMINFEKDFEELLKDCINKYGKYGFYDNQFIWMRPHNNLLPSSTRAVSISLAGKELVDNKLDTKNVRIIYYLLEP